MHHSGVLADGRLVLDTLKIALPDDLAAELDADGLGYLPRQQRGADPVSLATLVVDTASALTVLIVNRRDLRDVVRRFVSHARERSGEGPSITVHVTIGQSSDTLDEANDASGQRKLEVSVTARLDPPDVPDRR